MKNTFITISEEILIMFILTKKYTLYISVEMFFANTKFIKAKNGRMNENKLYIL